MLLDDCSSSQVICSIFRTKNVHLLNAVLFIVFVDIFIYCLLHKIFHVGSCLYFTSISVIPSSQIPTISVGIRFSAKRLSQVVQLDSTKLDIVWVYNRLTNYPPLSRVVNSFFILLNLLLLTNSFKNSRL